MFDKCCAKLYMYFVYSITFTCRKCTFQGLSLQKIVIDGVRSD